jgi:glycosyltransferase involved in cell wall biosynthesis
LGAKVLFLESFYGGSHREFADGLVENSRFEIDLHTMAQRSWKWRMRGASLYFSKKVSNPETYDALIVSDLLSFAELKALWGSACPPSLVYFHESQLTYPLPPGERLDVQFAFTEVASALSADRVLFNSRFHRDLFLEKLPQLLSWMPDYRPKWIIDELVLKSVVLYPGCRLDVESAVRAAKGAPIILWNHRWEFDKCPEVFFEVLRSLKRKGLKFRLAVLGENFQVLPRAFLQAEEEFSEEILHFGYLESRKDYLSWLWASDIVVSAAIQENFGIAMVEAMFAGCFPLLPKRLSYPELIGEEFYDRCLYDSPKDLEKMLENLLRSPQSLHSLPKELSLSMSKYSWATLVPKYDQVLESLIQGS